MCVSLIACSPGGIGSSASVDAQEEAEVRAIGMWELEKATLPADSVAGPLIEANGDFFGVALTSVVRRSGDDMNRCVEESGVETATLAFMKLGSGGFTPYQEFALVDEWVDIDDEPLLSLDVTEDGVDDVVVMSNCLAQPAFSALRLLDGGWTRLELPGVTSVVNGTLIGYQEDCLPSCVDSGVVWTLYRWNGQEVIPTGFVTSEGQPVSTKVEMGCTEFAIATSLPLKQCSEGPLVRKFLALARSSIGDYGPDASVSHAVNTFDERVATWVLTYRYRHGLPMTKEIDGKLFAALGGYWNPETPTERELFNRFCEGGSPLRCEYGERQIGYLFPSEECLTYRASSGAWPIQRCDYEGWVGVLAAALESFDGKEFEFSDGALLFDARLEERVRDFQRAVGLEVDGYVGRNTWRALYELPGSPLRMGQDLDGDGMFGPGDIIPH